MIIYKRAYIFATVLVLILMNIPLMPYNVTGQQVMASTMNQNIELWPDSSFDIDKPGIITSREYFYEFEKPEGWDLFKNYDGSKIVSRYIDVNNTITDFSTDDYIPMLYLNVTPGSVLPGIDFNQDNTLESRLDAAGYDNIQLRSSELINLGPNMGRAYVITYSDPQFGDLAQYLVIITKGDRTYEIGFVSERKHFDNIQPIVADTLSKFKIIESAPLMEDHTGQNIFNTLSILNSKIDSLTDHVFSEGSGYNLSSKIDSLADHVFSEVTARQMLEVLESIQFESSPSNTIINSSSPQCELAHTALSAIPGIDLSKRTPKDALDFVKEGTLNGVIPTAVAAGFKSLCSA